MVYAKDRVEPTEITTYEDLADPKWQGRICIRSSTNVYNQSLTASMIEADGVEATEAWAKGLVANFAREPQGGDTDQIKAVAAGECDIAVVNHYYYVRLLKSAEDAAIGDQVGIVFPNQDGRGAHANISGAGVVATAPHPENAIKFLEYLTTEQAQIYFAEGNNEFPVVAGVKLDPVLDAWGEIKTDARQRRQVRREQSGGGHADGPRRLEVASATRRTTRVKGECAHVRPAPSVGGDRSDRRRRLRRHGRRPARSMRPRCSPPMPTSRTPTYEDSLLGARDLQAAVDALLAAPSAATQQAAKDAWRAARVPYQQSEAYRFGNPIVDDWEGKVNAWPLDEGLIDYVAGAYGDESDENAFYVANVIANPTLTSGGATIDASTIDTELIRSLHEIDEVEANVATGYHAIEFLLWGQDLNGTGPGAGDAAVDRPGARASAPAATASGAAPI